MAKRELTAEELEHKAAERRQALAMHDPTSVLETHLDCLEETIERLDAKYNPISMKFAIEDIEADPGQMVARVVASAMPGTPQKDASAMGVAMDTYIQRKWAQKVADARRIVAPYDESAGIAEIKKFCAYVRGFEEDHQASDTDVAAMMSHFWQIKRKLGRHYQNNYPVMVIFTGGQEFGKSKLLERLHANIADMKSGAMQLKSFNNEFNAVVYNQYYVVPFEEMNSKTHYDVEVFKTLVTEGNYNYRPPHMKRYAKLDNLATLIGTSNHPVAESIPDTTGARRWWEIPVVSRAFNEARDLPRLQRINFEAMWLAVDGESDRNPRIPHLDAMRIAQVAMKQQSDKEQFLAECVEMWVEGKSAGPAPAEVTGVEMWDAFVQWCDYNGHVWKKRKTELFQFLCGKLEHSGGKTAPAFHKCSVTPPHKA